MQSTDAGIKMYDQEKLKPEVRDAALSAALSVLATKGVSPSDATRAYSTDLMLSAVSDGAEHTDDHYREHGASRHAFEAYHAAKDAAVAEIARLDPVREDFRVLFFATD